MHIDNKICTYLPAIIDNDVRERCTSTFNVGAKKANEHDRKRTANITTDLNKNMPAIVVVRNSVVSTTK